jgi:hypothetical protein
MRKYYITLFIIALFAFGFVASDEEKSDSQSNPTKGNTESIYNPSEPTKEGDIDAKKEATSRKAISQIKNIEELRQAINNTVWTHTTRGDAWLRYEFVDNTVKQYGALPRSGEWRYDGDSQFELSERRSDYDGRRYFVATFMPMTESIAMFELPVTFNFRDYHLYLNGQDMGEFTMADYEWD